jgi:predicted nucleic acid-binding protein
MMVVADIGLIHYLVLIGAVGVLESFYGRVLAPQTVAAELSAAGTPVMIKEWMARPPAWFEVHADPDPPPGSKLSFLDPGERAAILLAQSVGADRLLIDDWAGRAEAERQRLRITGTLGVLAAAHQRKLLDFEIALKNLQKTNFHLSGDLVERIRGYIAGW